ncbi:hypothetical protein ACFLUC_02165 [Chloroflexota bacterium]
MKLSRFISINSIILIGLGIAFGLYSPLMMAFFSIPEVAGMNSVSYWNVVAFARMYGAALFGFGLLLWAIRSIVESIPNSSRRGILYSLLFANVLSIFVVVTQNFSIWQNPGGWILTSIYAIQLMGYSYFLWIYQGESSLSETKPQE